MRTATSPSRPRRCSSHCPTTTAASAERAPSGFSTMRAAPMECTCSGSRAPTWSSHSATIVGKSIVTGHFQFFQHSLKWSSETEGESGCRSAFNLFTASFCYIFSVFEHGVCVCLPKLMNLLVTLCVF